MGSRRPSANCWPLSSAMACAASTPRGEPSTPISTRRSSRPRGPTCRPARWSRCCSRATCCMTGCCARQWSASPRADPSWKSEGQGRSCSLKNPSSTCKVPVIDHDQVTVGCSRRQDLQVMKRVLLSSLVAAAMVGGMPLAMAAQDIEAPADQNSASQLKEFEQARVPVSDAISAVERQSRGKAVDIAFELDHGKRVYRVRTYRDGAVWEGTLDATTGALIGQGTTTNESQLDPEDQAEIAGLKSARTSLTEAVANVQRQLGGKAFDAGVEQKGGNVVYEIRLVKTGPVLGATVDPASGQVSPDPTAPR